MSVARLKTAGFRIGSAILALAVVGCASDDVPKGGDPGARPLPEGYTCQSVRAELNKLDSQGARNSVYAASSGKKLSPQAQAQADRYNQLLNYYLGGRCHA